MEITIKINHTSFMIKCLANLFLFLSFTFSPICAEELSKILQQIPEQDLEDIRGLFSHFIYKSHFAYTLLGDKAVSLDSCKVLMSAKFKISNRRQGKPIEFSNNTLGAEWGTWKRYQSLFAIKRYLIIEEIPRVSSYIRHIMLINKEQFVNVFNEHQSTFHKILGHQVTGQGLLAEIEKQGKLRPVIKDNEMLFGILLGYGEHNATLYQAREDLRHHYDHFKYLLVKDAPAFKRLDIKADEITDVLKYCGESGYSLLAIPSIQFVADPHSQETSILKKKYRLLRGELSAIYAQGDLLEISLLTLMKD